MMEIAALLGALVFALGAIFTAKDDPHLDPGTFWTAALLVAPVAGALWGTAVGAAIHFAFRFIGHFVGPVP